MARKRSKWNYGFADIVHRGPLSLADAQFAARKRAEGVPDAEIAKMIGCTLASLQRGIIVDQGFASSGEAPHPLIPESPEMQRWRAERQERNKVARAFTTWRADAPNPLAKAASLPPDLPPARRR